MARRRLPNLEVFAVLAVTFAVFFHQETLTPLRHALFDEQYGAVPSTMWDAWRAFQEVGARPEILAAALPLITANYLHADVAHITGNMVFFWIFANVLSRAVGRTLLLVIYLAAGAVAVLIHVHANPTSDSPMIGASGAIAGLEGAYFTLVFRWEVPHANVWPFANPVPASSLAFLAVCNFALDTSSFVGHAQTHVAYGAHVGGFLGGALVAMIIASVREPTWRDA